MFARQPDAFFRSLYNMPATGTVSSGGGLAGVSAYDAARQGMNNWTVADWERYAQSSAPKATGLGVKLTGDTPWGGGMLSAKDASRATWVQQQAAIKEYEAKEAEAKAANEARYKEILGGYDQLIADVPSMLAGLGDQEKRDLQDYYKRTGSAAMSSLINSGLYGSTVAPTIQMQNTRRLSDAMARVNDRLNQQKVGYLTNLTQGKLGVMERRDDEYPSAADFLQLMNKAGNYAA